MGRISPDDLLDDIVLTMVEGVGSLTYQRLLHHFGDCETILSASCDELQSVDGVGPKIATQINTARQSCSPHALIELCRRECIEIISIRDVRYPNLLKTIYDPPPLLYVKGALAEQDALSIAVIGTRRMTAYGEKTTAQLTRGLAQYGLTIISGLAKGIDGVAHRTALEVGGRTIAVLGGGIVRLFPKEHTQLAEHIVQSGGAIISEYHPLMEPTKGTFPQRNRIVSGLSIGILVVEAPRKSGAMITARLSAEQGRELFAIPGRIDSEASGGCNQLIQDGAAMLVESVDDILEALGPLITPISHPTLLGKQPPQLRHPKELQLNEIEEAVLQAIETVPTSLEQIVERSKLFPHQVVAALIILETRCLIRKSGLLEQYVRI